MIAIRPSLLLAAGALLAGCATSSPPESERTVFNNPYAAPVIARTGVGPQCDVARGRDATCLGVPLTRKGRGAVIGDRVTGNLTSNQRRILRERAEVLREAGEQRRTPPPPPPPAEPKPADEAGAMP